MSESIEHICAAAWRETHWHIDMPSFAHERFWEDDWGDQEYFRDLFRAIVKASFRAVKGDLTEVQYKALFATEKHWSEFDAAQVWNTAINALLAEPQP